MSLRATSHGDFQTLSGSAGKSPSLEDRMYKSMSMSSSNVTGGSRFGSGELEEVKGLIAQHQVQLSWGSGVGGPHRPTGGRGSGPGGWDASV